MYDREYTSDEYDRQGREGSILLLEDDVLVGDVVRFGGYDWIVLAIRGGEVLLITEGIIDKRPYNGKLAETTWADCDLRRYLNGGFYNSFSAGDRARIVETRNENECNPSKKTAGGEDTTDKVFILGFSEALEFLGGFWEVPVLSWTDSIGFPDWHATPRGYHEKDTASLWFWLRTPGTNAFSAACLLDDKAFATASSMPANLLCGVRPALWLRMGD